MLGFEIITTLHKISLQVYQRIAGLCSIDNVPDKCIDKGNFLIVNLCDSVSGEGPLHWIVIHRDVYSNLEIFNSLGVKSTEDKKLLSDFLPFNVK